MPDGPNARLLRDGRRLHLSHGPIDLIVEAFGPDREVSASYGQASTRFRSILSELAEELEDLRKPATDCRPQLRGRIARRMVEAVWPHRSTWVTPMAAVAGAVADEVIVAMTANRTLARAYVNNSGDISLHIGPGESFRLGLVGVLNQPAIDKVAIVSAEQGIGGVATSGWRGRSHSLGIADSVTTLASTAAAADVAATLIANAVTADHPSVERVPARDLDDNTDLGDQLVTTAVGPLDSGTVEAALASGSERADEMIRGGLIAGAALTLSGSIRTLGAPELFSV